MSSSIAECIIELFNREFDCNLERNEDTYHKKWNEIGIDSFKFVQAIILVERTYSIEIEEDDLSMDILKNIDDLSKYIDRKLGLK